MARQHGRSGGHAGRQALRARAPAIGRWRTAREIPVYELVSPEGIERLHDASMTILEEVGVEVRDAEAVALWRAAGARIEGMRVRIPRELAMETLAKAPAQFTQHARNPKRSVTIGGNHTVFAPTYGSPFVRGFDNERRYGTLDDLETFVKLAYMAPMLDHSGGVICEPVDVPVPQRHLDIVYRERKSGV